MMSIHDKIKTIVNDYCSHAKTSNNSIRKHTRVKDTEILEILHYSLLLHSVLVRCSPKITEARRVESSPEHVILVQVTLRLTDVFTGEVSETIGYGSAQASIGKAIVTAMLNATKFAWLSCIKNARR